MRFMMLTLALLFSGTVHAGDATTIKVVVEGVTCPSCAASIENRVKELPGVKSVEISIGSGNLTVFLKDGATVSETEISKAVEAAGYKLKSSHERI
jgi:copper chaperone CopZ